MQYPNAFLTVHSVIEDQWSKAYTCVLYSALPWDKIHVFPNVSDIESSPTR